MSVVETALPTNIRYKARDIFFGQSLSPVVQYYRCLLKEDLITEKGLTKKRGGKHLHRSAMTRGNHPTRNLVPSPKALMKTPQMTADYVIPSFTMAMTWNEYSARLVTIGTT